VIYPPVDVVKVHRSVSRQTALDNSEESVLASLPADFILGASRFVTYKSLDHVISLGAAADVPVVLAGGGPDESRLRHIAGQARVPVVFINRPSDTFLYQLYQLALAYIFPPVEDFGIMPVEAMAAGAHVMVNRVGGASESVIPGVSGAHFDPEDIQSGLEGLSQVSSVDRENAVRRASFFSTERFESDVQRWVGGS
jgi:glycosyltransferase involved in cell wall biosynthesis